MQNLLTSLILMCATSCATSIYKIHQSDRDKVGLVVSADRIVLVCEDVQDPTNPIDPDGRYGFMIHVLDDANTVTTFVQGNVIGRDWCKIRIQHFQKMQQSAKILYLAGLGDIHAPHQADSLTVSFPKHGVRSSNGRTIGFTMLKSPDGFCITAHAGNKRPCPEEYMFPEAVHPF